MHQSRTLPINCEFDAELTAWSKLFLIFYLASVASFFSWTFFNGYTLHWTRISIFFLTYLLLAAFDWFSFRAAVPSAEYGNRRYSSRCRSLGTDCPTRARDFSVLMLNLPLQITLKAKIPPKNWQLILMFLLVRLILLYQTFLLDPVAFTLLILESLYLDKASWSITLS